jgi:hypothetical protein
MRVLSKALCVFLVALPVFGQGDRGTITGTITDPGGLVIAAAPIVVRNVETAAVYQVGSSATGNYVVQIPTGTYELSVTLQGFKKYVRQNMVVPVAQTLRVDIALALGSSSESVTVTEAAPLLKTENGEISHNIVADTLDNLPVLGIGAASVGATGIRSPYSAMNVLPGTSWTPDSSLRVNGQEGNTSALRVEGQDATNTITRALTSTNSPSVEAIQEFALQTSSYAAEFGQAGGGLFNFTMKSGTNQLHGSAYDYFANEALNAGVPFTNNGQGSLLRPRQRRNDYGFSLGGPIYVPKIYNGHDKTFFFFNFEQFRETTITNNVATTVPTVAMRSGDFRQILTNRNLGVDGLNRPLLENTIYDPGTARVVNGITYTDPYPNNTIPLSQQDPVALRVQALIPLPTNSALINNYLPTYANPRLTEIPSVKIDHSFSPSLKLSGYWAETKTDSPNISAFPFPIANVQGSHIRSNTIRLNLDYILTPTLLLHVGAGFVDVYSNPQVPAYDPVKGIGFTGGNASPPVFPSFGSLSGSQGGSANLGPGGPFIVRNLKPTATTSMTWVHNSHTYKAGGEMIVNGFPSFSQGFSAGSMAFNANETGLPALNGVSLPATVGFSYASFLIGAPFNGYDSVPAAERLGNHSFGFFAQDNWKVTRKLTLEYGLRYDFQTYLREHNGYMLDVSPGTPNPAAGGEPGGIIFEGNGGGRCNCSLAHNYPWAFGPRLGVAYQMNQKTVFRLGAGVSYAQTSNEGSTANNTGSNKSFAEASYGVPPFYLRNGLPYQITFPNFYAGQQPLPGTTSAPTNYLDPNAGRPARVIQWSIGLQREVAKDLVIEAAYVGNRGVWWAAATLNPISNDAISTDRLASYGLSLNNAADLKLLASPVNSVLAASRTFNCTPAVITGGVQTAPAIPGGGNACSFGTPPYPGFPTGLTVAQALRPMPEYTMVVNHWDPMGDTWYDSLQAKVTKRLSHGLDFQVSYTWSKSLALGAEDNNNYFGIAGTTGGGFGPALNDVFNRAIDKTLSGYDQPQLLVVAGNYITPKLTGGGKLGNKYLSWASRDWRIGAVLRYGSGMPIKVPNATSGLSSYTFQTSFANRVPGVPLFTQDINCHCFDPNATFVLNPAAWVNPAPGQYGTSAGYYSDYRYQRRPVENLSIGRNFPFGEGRMNLQIRAEFTNIFNRTEVNNPTSSNAFATQTRNAAGQATAGFGYINNATVFSAPRQGQLVARFQF